MPKWRPMDGEGCHGVPLLKKVIELAPHVVVLDVRVKQKNGMSSMWNLAAQKQVCVSTDLRGYFVIDTLYYMHARARARARPRRRKSVFFSALVQPAAARWPSCGAP